MNVPLLIDAVVRQTTVLIAQLATTGGVRAPVAHLANQVFLDLAREFESQGVSRKVSADMFGMALRAYLRKIQRLTESSTEHGRSLWEAASARLRELSLAQAIVWVLAANEQAIRFYERVGFALSRGSETPVEIGGMRLPKVRYEIAIA